MLKLIALLTVLLLACSCASGPGSLVGYWRGADGSTLLFRDDGTTIAYKSKAPLSKDRFEYRVDDSVEPHRLLAAGASKDAPYAPIAIYEVQGDHLQLSYVTINADGTLNLPENFDGKVHHLQRIK